MKDSTSKHELNREVQVRVPTDYPWRVLDAISNDLACCLDTDSLAELKGVVRSRDYNRYLALSEAWSPQSTIHSRGISVEQFYAKYQASALLKKYQFPTDSEARRATALKKFKAAEEACYTFNREGSRQLAYLSDTNELQIYTYAREFLSRLLGEELPERKVLTLWSRHGPGSNLDTKEGRISLYDKYSAWPYSCTRGARELAKLSIQDDERWLGALEDDYRRVKGIEPWRILDQDRFWSDVLHVVPGNKICFVPKNSQTDRSIAIEPCMNLYLQLGVDGYIRRRLKRWGVDLDDQTKNQELARRGSKHWMEEDSFVTLDLSAASDSISLEVCRLLLPPQWYRYLIKLRSPVGVCEGETIVYNKISSMGNGYTFALESAIFASVIYGVEMLLKGSFNRDEIAVFGDDLIVRYSSSSLVVQMLNRCGFTLNPEKSFMEGPFRESCGADWFGGMPVRPVFLSAKPSTVMELWNDSNRLRRVLSLRVMGFEFESTKLIRRWIPEQFLNCRGPLSDQDFDSYEHSPTPTVKWKEGSWLFPRLVARPKSRKGDSILFRKLMHTLRAAEQREPYRCDTWGGLRLSGKGSRFTVTKRSAVAVGYSYSPAFHWQDQYSDLGSMGPIWPRPKPSKISITLRRLGLDLTGPS